MQNPPQPSTSTKRSRRLALMLCAALAGCASQPPQKGQDTPSHEVVAQEQETLPPATTLPSLAPDTNENAWDPLIDARYRSVITCESEQPMEAGDKLGEVRLVCKGINVSATITEFRDAGWRIEDLKMSEIKTPEGAIVIPLRLTLRKLF